jgi:quercetin dioxygenase-like cupin family protein
MLKTGYDTSVSFVGKVNHMEPEVIKASEGLTLMGGRQTIKLYAANTNKSVSVMFSKVPAGSGIPTHIHQFEDEIFQMVSGNLEVTIDGKCYSLHQGDMIFMPRHIPHGFMAVTDVQIWVTFTPGGNEKMFEALAMLSPGPPAKKDMEAICAPFGVTFP